MLDTQEIGDTVGTSWKKKSVHHFLMNSWKGKIWLNLEKSERSCNPPCGCSVRNTLCGDSLTLIPNSKASGCARSVCGQLNEEIPWLAEEAFVGQILHLVWIIQGSCIDAVAILDQEPCKKKNKKKEKKEKAREKDWISRVRLISEFKTQAVLYWSAGSCTADLNYTWHVSISIYLKQLFAEFQTAVPQLWRSAQFKNYILKKCKQLFFYKQCLCRLVENLTSLNSGWPNLNNSTSWNILKQHWWSMLWLQSSTNTDKHLTHTTA